MSQYFPTALLDYKNIKVKIDLTNYATKQISMTHVDTSNFVLETNLANLKTEVDKLDIDKLVPVPVNLSKLSDLLKNDVVKKDVYDKLVAKANNIDTSDFVLKLSMVKINQNQKRKFLMQLILSKKQNSLNQKTKCLM